MCYSSCRFIKKCNRRNGKYCYFFRADSADFCRKMFSRHRRTEALHISTNVDLYRHHTHPPADRTPHTLPTLQLLIARITFEFGKKETRQRALRRYVGTSLTWLSHFDVSSSLIELRREVSGDALSVRWHFSRLLQSYLDDFYRWFYII